MHSEVQKVSMSIYEKQAKETAKGCSACNETLLNGIYGMCEGCFREQQADDQGGHISYVQDIQHLENAWQSSYADR